MDYQNSKDKETAMVQKIKATEAAPNTCDTKIEKEKDITKVLNYFRYTTGTTLDCMIATGVLRNSITYYVRDLENIGVLQAVYRMPDKHTHRLAKHYSADKSQWKQDKELQLSLFEKEGGHNGL
ncbi:hypothetical protein [Phocaeicola sp.]|uniref:hypothetical protein n=1 Tax=Phocaeicola sp. TaxID=2773926 RepID=UPI00262A4631|nr:hypothetical protein [Phocaeicola sp.]